MPDKKPIEESIVARVVQGVRYMLTGSKPDEWFGPGQPIAPQAQDKDGVPGRQFDFAVNYNTRRAPRDGEGVTFDQMRALADSYDLLRLVIETRKDQMEKLNWTFGLRPEIEKQQKVKERHEAAKKSATKVKAKNDSLAAGEPPPPIGHSEVPDIPEPPKEDPRVQELRDFFSFPDQEHGWKTWLRALLEDLLVIDAATVYPRMTLGGDLYSLELLDGSTVKRILDSSGRTPLPPDVAYQQVLKGMPAVDYSRDELLYRPRNVRTHKVYGYSPVEQIIMTVNIAMRRQLHQLQYYTEGNVPEALMGVPEEWNPDQIKQFQEYWDSLMEGNTAARRHAKFVPGGMNVTLTKEAALKDQYDEWLARIIAFAFSISPQALVQQMNRATAETAQTQALQEGLLPVMNWVKDLMDYIVWKYFGYTDLEFKWDEEDEPSPEIQMKVLTGYVTAKVMDVDEARDKIGLPALTAEQKASMAPPAPPPLGMGGPPGSPTPPGAAPAAGGTEKPVGKLLGSGLRKASVAIARDRASVKKTVAAITDSVRPALAAAGKRIARELADKVGKAVSGDKQTKRLLQELTFEELRDLAPDLADMLEDMAADGGAAGLAQVIADITKDQLAQVNERAVEYAKDRSATLVTQLEDSTREMLRGTLAQAMEEGWSNDKLADELDANYAFGPERAETIARTETAYADVQGNLEGYRASGVVQGKQWIIAQDEYCDDCNELDGVIVGLEYPFPNDGGDGPPLHPNCRCDILPVLTTEEDN